MNGDYQFNYSVDFFYHEDFGSFRRGIRCIIGMVSISLKLILLCVHSVVFFYRKGFGSFRKEVKSIHWNGLALA